MTGASKRPLIALSRGCTREVVLVGSWALKLPSLRSWRLFLTGLLCNQQETSFASLGWPEVCPVKFSIPGGFLVVMPRVIPLSESRKEPVTDEEFEAWTVRADGEIPAEAKLDSFGSYEGRVVAIDYGGPGWDITLKGGAERGWLETE